MRGSTRRQFMSAVTIAAGVDAATRPQIGISPFVWTQKFKALGENLAEIFAATRRAGYREIEITPAFLKPNLRDHTIGLLKKYEFRVPMVYSRGTMEDDAGLAAAISDVSSMLDALDGLGCHAVNVNPNRKRNHERKTDEDLNIQARNLNRLGNELDRRNVRLLVHNHNVEMQEQGREWRSILRLTDPALVGFCIDVHWVLRGGQDPMAVLREAGARTGALHLRNSTNGVWNESFGPGDIDYLQIAAFLRKIHFGGMLLIELAYEQETKPARPLEQDLKLSREYAQQVFKRA